MECSINMLSPFGLMYGSSPSFLYFLSRWSTLVENRLFSAIDYIRSPLLLLHCYIFFSLDLFSSVQFSHSVVSDSFRLHESQHARLPVHHQLPEFIQTHVHRVGDAIQPSHPLSSPSPPAPNPSQHQGLFQWVKSSHEVAKVLEFQPQHQSFQWTPRTGLL